MTYLEKLKLENPEYSGYESDGLPGMCPYGFGYEKDPWCKHSAAANCEYCWNREIPETETVDETAKNKRTVRCLCGCP